MMPSYSQKHKGGLYIITKLEDASTEIGLRFNLSRKKVMCPDDPEIFIREIRIQYFTTYKYIGQITIIRENQKVEIEQRTRLTWAYILKI